MNLRLGIILSAGALALVMLLVGLFNRPDPIVGTWTILRQLGEGAAPYERLTLTIDEDGTWGIFSASSGMKRDAAPCEACTWEFSSGTYSLMDYRNGTATTFGVVSEEADGSFVFTSEWGPAPTLDNPLGGFSTALIRAKADEPELTQLPAAYVGVDPMWWTFLQEALDAFNSGLGTQGGTLGADLAGKRGASCWVGMKADARPSRVLVTVAWEDSGDWLQFIPEPSIEGGYDSRLLTKGGDYESLGLRPEELDALVFSGKAFRCQVGPEGELAVVITPGSYVGLDWTMSAALEESLTTFRETSQSNPIAQELFRKSQNGYSCWAGFFSSWADDALITFIWPNGEWLQFIPRSDKPLGYLENSVVRGDRFSDVGLDPSRLNDQLQNFTTYRCGVIPFGPYTGGLTLTTDGGIGE